MLGSRSCAIATAERFGLDATSIKEIWEGRRPCVGVNGAAGGMLVADGPNGPQVLLTLRSAAVHHGSCWSLPGGAIDFNSAILDVPANSKRLELGFAGDAR